MTLQEFFGVIENSDRIRIIKDEADVFTGYLATFRPQKRELFEQYKDEQIKKFRAVPEIRHKHWEELNLMKPLEPDETPDFSFSDLQMYLYYTIYL